jgi:hypothetical protein
MPAQGDIGVERVAIRMKSAVALPFIIDLDHMYVTIFIRNIHVSLVEYDMVGPLL